MNRQINDEACIRYLEDISKMFERGKENCAGAALEFQQKYIDALQYAIKELRKTWIPVKYRPCDDEEFEDMKKLFGEDIVRDDFPFFDCPMPDDGQEILITTVWGVEKDTCEYDRDYGYTLEGRGDWEGVTAWMPSPKPYVKGGEEE